MAVRCRIRLAAEEDAPAVSSVLRAAFYEYESLYTKEAFLATTPTSNQVQARMKEGPIWVAVWEQTIVGTVAAVERKGGCYVRSMAVLPATRGRNIGTMLLKEVEAFATKQGCDRLFLSTTPFLHSAIRLHETFGFRRSDEGPHDLFGTALFTMVRELVR